MNVTYQLRFLIGLAIALAYTYAAFEYKWSVKRVTCEIPVYEEEEEAILVPPVPDYELKSLPTKIIVPVIRSDSSEEKLMEKSRALFEQFLQDTLIVEEEIEEIEIIEEVELEEEDDHICVEEVFYVVEEDATPVGGYKAFFKYIKKRLAYPTEAYRQGIKGKVFISFTVAPDGKLADFKIEKSVHPLLDAAALEVIRNAPAWNPGKQRGRPVRQRMTLPFRFR